jgi:hypothetical protein
MVIGKFASGANFLNKFLKIYSKVILFRTVFRKFVQNVSENKNYFKIISLAQICSLADFPLKTYCRILCM